jgi:hypothetical protein
MRHFSIRTSMFFIVFCALGLAALKNGDGVWAGAMLLIAVAAVGTAIVGAAIMRGRERDSLAAFALFAGGYLVLTFAPGFTTEVMPRLLTTKALDFVHADFFASTSRETLPQMLWWQHARVLAEVDRLKAENRTPGDPELDSAIRMLESLETRIDGAADKRDFIRAGHAIFALFAGLFGGLVGAAFHARREREEVVAR